MMIKYISISIILWVWQLPQHLLALFLWLFFKLTRKLCVVRKTSEKVFPPSYLLVVDYRIGLSLGNFIFLHDHCTPDSLLHEYGHSLQSKRFGPLYLLVVGIPSAIFCNLWDRLFHKKWDSRRRLKWYYTRFPENNADKLGGVHRDF